MSLLIKGRKRASEAMKHINWGETPFKKLVIPDQSLSLREIMQRYTRGVPVDVKHHRPVWIDQTEHDYENYSRMEFSDKMSVAERLRAEYDAIVEANEAKRSQIRANEEQLQKASNSENITQKEPVEGSKA